MYFLITIILYKTLPDIIVKFLNKQNSSFLSKNQNNWFNVQVYVPGAIISEEFEFEIETCCSGILQRNLTTKREIALSCTQLLCSEPTSISRHITQPTFSFRTCSFFHCPRPLATWQRAAKLSRTWKLKLTKPGSSPHTTSIVLSAPAKRGDPTRQAA